MKKKYNTAALASNDIQSAFIVGCSYIREKKLKTTPIDDAANHVGNVIHVNWRKNGMIQKIIEWNIVIFL
jgi:hypothetical protein